MEQLHQVILNMLVTKYLDNKVFDYIYPWGETLSYIALPIRASYHHTIQYTPCQDFFGRCMLFNLMSVVYWRAITAWKQQQVDIDNVLEMLDGLYMTANLAIYYMWKRLATTKKFIIRNRDHTE